MRASVTTSAAASARSSRASSASSPMRSGSAPTPRPVRRLVVSSGSRISAPSISRLASSARCEPEASSRASPVSTSRCGRRSRSSPPVSPRGRRGRAASDQQRGAHLQRELVLSVLEAFATQARFGQLRPGTHSYEEGAMPQQAWSKKRERQYEHIKEGSLKEQGRSEDKAEEIAARTVNKERARAGEARQRSKTSTDDISSGRARWAPVGNTSTEGPHEGPALRRGEAQEREGPVEDVQGAAPARCRPLARPPSRVPSAALPGGGWAGVLFGGPRPARPKRR